MLDVLLDGVGDRPMPAEELRAVSARLREAIGRPGWPSELLIECGGLGPRNLPPDDVELWLGLAEGVASPKGSEGWSERAAANGDSDGELDETDSAVAAICAIDHFDWLAVMTALAAGGPGTSASAADLAAYVRDYDPDEDEDADADSDTEIADTADDDLGDIDEDFGDDEFDELTMESLFLPVTTLWQVLGAIDDDDRLTSLGWWGLPEAMRRVWVPTGGPQG
jgi:hypothetical protein